MLLSAPPPLAPIQPFLLHLAHSPSRKLLLFCTFQWTLPDQLWCVQVRKDYGIKGSVGARGWQETMRLYLREQGSALRVGTPDVDNVARVEDDIVSMSQAASQAGMEEAHVQEVSHLVPLPKF